ncbi:hypothetical protein K2173_019168 [Erythroxylum novogranatense]|uniref:Chlororespiratory reduction 4 n=1 Tax=Erythroxylum novogranatense TaxID=1862640 RepID=A0AAV8STX2_9ROSI|nr:hypothetical protein K2173_019168 [Erythroxylum novogranatense]
MLALCTGPLKYVELPFYYLQVRCFNSIWKTQKPILTVNDSQLLCCLSQQRLQEARNLLEKMPGRSSHARVVYWTSILNNYWRVGFVDEARALLDIMPERNVVSYNAMLAGYVQWGRLSEAWKLFEEMPERNVVSWTSMLCGYADTGMIREARRLFEEMPERNVVSWNAMIVGLIRNGDLDGAKRVFVDMPVRSVVSWNAMIAGLVENGRVKEARMLFEEMDDKNVITWTTMICGHCREGNVRDGYSLFRRMPGRNVVSWTAMISGFTWNGLYEEALLLFLEMKSNSNVKPNAEAYISLAYACTGVGFLCFGKQLHAQIIVNGLEYDDYDGRLCKSLIHMYSSFGIMDSADHIFNKKSCNFDLHSCNHMIDGYVRTGQLEKAESLFNILPDRNKITWTSMICGYFSAGLLQKACYLFYSMPDKDAVAWTSMISGHVQNELFAEAACLFSEMKANCVSPLTSTYAILLGATGAVAYLDYGKQLHSMLVKTMTDLHLIVNNSLISMYAKCGEVEDAHRIFTSMISKDIISWNTMIMGFSHHGLAKAALQTFEAMLETETQLDSVTFLGILSACSNAGLAS